MAALDLLSAVLAALAAISAFTYVALFLFDRYCPEQDLKKKYGATWAVVTGSSSGIGRALTEKLARQGLNVVMVALEDAMLKDTHALLSNKYPNVQLRKVGADLSRPGYLEVIARATSDIEPTLIFNNAGFVMTGLFADTPLEKLLANYECNATAPLNITHHFLNRMLDKKLRGCVGFTSSPAGFLPGPMASLYGSTKAFLTELAVSIAPEVQPDGIDVLVVHPSPVNTAFYAGNKHDLGAMKFFQGTATSPETIASCFFRSMGRTIVHDQGYFSFFTRMLLKVLDSNLLAIIIARSAKNQADYKKSKKKR